MATVAYVNNPDNDAQWSIQDCVSAAAQLVDDTLDVIEFAQSPGHLPDALVVGSRSTTIRVFPDIPMARLAVVTGPPGPPTRMRLEVFNGQQPTNFRFHPNDFGLAVMDVARWMDASLQLGVSIAERRKIEAIQRDVASAIHDGMFENIPELAAQLRAVAATLEAQMKATHAGRKVVGWCLRQLNTFPAGVLGSVAASYLFELLPHFAR